MTTLSVSVAFIGGGNMAQALAAGLLEGSLSGSQLHVIEVNDDTQAFWRERGASVASSPDERLACCDVWIFAVKPQVMRDVVNQARPWLRQPLVISIAAGLRASSLARWLGADAGAPWQRLVRCMPNTPALVGAGVTGLVAPASLALSDRQLAEQLLQAVGDTVWVDDEDTFDAVTALSGSGPAYVFAFLESLIEGGQRLGLDADQARRLALGTLAGATRLAADSPETPAVLRQRVTSPGGTTAAALGVLEARGWAPALQDAMAAAARRAAQLGDELD